MALTPSFHLVQFAASFTSNRKVIFPFFFISIKFINFCDATLLFRTELPKLTIFWHYSRMHALLFSFRWVQHFKFISSGNIFWTVAFFFLIFSKIITAFSESILTYAIEKLRNDFVIIFFSPGYYLKLK